MLYSWFTHAFGVCSTCTAYKYASEFGKWTGHDSLARPLLWKLCLVPRAGRLDPSASFCFHQSTVAVCICMHVPRPALSPFAIGVLTGASAGDNCDALKSHSLTGWKVKRLARGSGTKSIHKLCIRNTGKAKTPAEVVKVTAMSKLFHMILYILYIYIYSIPIVLMLLPNEAVRPLLRCLDHLWPAHGDPRVLRASLPNPLQACRWREVPLAASRSRTCSGTATNANKSRGIDRGSHF